MAHSPDHSLDSFSGTPSAAPSGPPWPNPLASIAYASCRPADCEPPAEDSALTSRAAYERLNRAAARAETLVLYRLDMLSGCRDSLDVDQTRLERSIQNLWRLTAVRKTLMSIEAALNAPTPAPQGSAPESELQSALDEVRRLLAEVPTESAPAPAAPADQSAPASAEPPLPVVLSPSPSPSPSQSGLESQSQSQSRSQSQSTPPTESTVSTPSSSTLDIGHLTLDNPQSLLAIRSVPACPRLSLSSVARTLGRVNADMANYTEYVTTAADYASNVTAEEFLRPSLSPKSSHVPAHAYTLAPSAVVSAPAADQASTPIADNSTSDLLADPDFSPSLKSQLSNLKSPPRPSPAGHPVSPQLQSLLDLKQSLDRHRPPD